jgi:peroxiredoxin
MLIRVGYAHPFFEGYIMKNVPQVTFKTRVKNPQTDEFDWQYPTTDDYFAGKKVIAFSLPGAFTPTCSNFQVPGYQAMYGDFKALGIDEVYCIACNDAFVMNAWAKDQRAADIKFIPDGSCEFTAGMEMVVAKDNLGFGVRSWRYAMIVNDGVIEKMFIEPGKSDDCETDPYGETSPETVREYLREVASN